MRNFVRIGAASAIAIVCSTAAFAQETTSSVRGTVTAGDTPVAGAEITVRHEPSGTTATTSSGPDGTFSASGLRVGGPFTVTVKAAGYSDGSVSDIQLSAGQPLRLSIPLEPAGSEIVVTGASQANSVRLSSGPNTVLNLEKIKGVASISRDIRDIARRDPFVTLDPTNSRGISIAGANSRLNRFSVDGQRFSDNFGLNNGGLPTARGPVPLDAIGELQVKIAPYDVTEGDFQGGAINLVLRSGGNAFHGSAFYTYTDDSLTGDRTKASATNPTGNVALDYKSKNYGAFLSGPIIKDRLFFAFSYEHLAETTPVSFGLAGFPNVVPNITQAQLDNVTAIAKSKYGYDTLGLLNSFTEKDEKYTAKIDWNITDGQRASATYIHNKGTIGSDPGFSTTSPASPALSYASNLYNRPETVDSGTVQLNSDWSDNFHTEIRGNYRKYDLLPTALGASTLGQFQVCLDPTNPATGAGASPTTCSQGTAASPGSARLYFGPDQFRQANLVKTRSYGLDIVMRWEQGDHSLKLEAGYNHQKALNVFVQNALGGVYFDSLADFAAGRAGTFALGGSITGNLDDIQAGFQYEQFNFGLQDSWDVTDRLNATFGVRTDLFKMSDTPPFNAAFAARYAAQGLTNTEQFSGKIVAQPRFGLTWKATDQLVLRGGIGLFAGGTPDVFLGNSFSVPGVFNNAISIGRTATGFSGVTADAAGAAIASAALDNVTGANFPAAVLNYLQTNISSIALANTNSMSHNFQPASTWKTSFSADYKPEFDWLGSGWNFGGDFYYGFTNYAPIYTDLRLTQIGTLPDGRPRYATITPTSPNTDLFLSNTKQGHSLVAVARFNKHFDLGLDIGASYTFQDIKDVNPMNGTTASGSYGQSAAVDPNKAAYGTSIYQIRNSLKFNVDFDHAFFGDYKTRFSLFGERRSGSPYSLTMTDPAVVNSHSTVFGVASSGASGQINRFLLYVPNVSSMTADPLVSYDSAATFAGLQSFVQTNGLKQGGIIKKNSERSPSYFKIDLHVDQEIPLPLVPTGRVKIFADMENVLNLINRKWGSLRQVAFPYLAPTVNVACATMVGTNCTQYRYSNFQSPNIQNFQRFSLWGIRVGAKVEF